MFLKIACARVLVTCSLAAPEHLHPISDRAENLGSESQQVL